MLSRAFSWARGMGEPGWRGPFSHSVPINSLQGPAQQRVGTEEEAVAAARCPQLLLLGEADFSRKGSQGQLGTQRPVDFSSSIIKHGTWACQVQHTPTPQQAKQHTPSLAPTPFPWKKTWVQGSEERTVLPNQWGGWAQSSRSPRRAPLPARQPFDLPACLSQARTPHTTAALVDTPNIISLTIKLCMRKQIPGRHLTSRTYRQQQVSLHVTYHNYFLLEK